MTSRGTSRRSAAFEDNFDIKFSLALGNLSREPRESAGTRGLKTDGAWPSCWATHGQNGVRVLLSAGHSIRHQPQSGPGKENKFAILHLHPPIRIIRYEQVAVHVSIT